MFGAPYQNFWLRQFPEVAIFQYKQRFLIKAFIKIYNNDPDSKLRHSGRITYWSWNELMSVSAQFLHVAEDVHLVVCVQFFQHWVCGTKQPRSCGTIPACMGNKCSTVTHPGFWYKIYLFQTVKHGVLPRAGSNRGTPLTPLIFCQNITKPATFLNVAHTSIRVFPKFLLRFQFAPLLQITPVVMPICPYIIICRFWSHV